MDPEAPNGGPRRAVLCALFFLLLSEYVLAGWRLELNWTSFRFDTWSVIIFGGGGCTAFLLWKIYQGRGWARATLATLIALGLAFWLASTSATFQHSKIEWSLSAAQFALRVCAMILLFKSPGSDWFAAHPLRYAPAIASVIFTIALIWFIPIGIEYTTTASNGGDQSDFYHKLYFEELHNFGITLLAIVLIGLIVTWAAYARRARWAWLVMFVIVWGWFFPVVAWHDFVYAMLRGSLVGGTPSLPILLLMATSKQHLERGFAQEVLVFACMLAALLLPMKSFFWSRESPQR